MSGVFGNIVSTRLKIITRVWTSPKLWLLPRRALSVVLLPPLVGILPTQLGPTVFQRHPETPIVQRGWRSLPWVSQKV